jgi:hypothetical protein
LAVGHCKRTFRAVPVFFLWSVKRFHGPGKSNKSYELLCYLLIFCQAQTESAYFRPNPATPEPFRAVDGKIKGDPRFGNCGNATSGCSPWALRIENTHDMTVVGAGFYSWFLNNYAQTCIEPHKCQQAIVEIDEPSSNIQIYNLFTVGSKEMITSRNQNPVLASKNQMLKSTSPWTSCVAAWVRGAGSAPVMALFNM